MNTDIAYKYLPERSYNSPFVSGLPARDIAEWEVKADPDMEALILANMETPGAIYAKVEPAKVSKTSKAKSEDVPVVEASSDT